MNLRNDKKMDVLELKMDNLVVDLLEGRKIFWILHVEIVWTQIYVVRVRNAKNRLFKLQDEVREYLFRKGFVENS